MRKNKFRVFIVETLCKCASTLTFLITLGLVFTVTGYWLPLLICFFGVCISAYLLMMACTISEVDYLSNHPFASYVIED